MTQSFNFRHVIKQFPAIENNLEDRFSNFFLLFFFLVFCRSIFILIRLWRKKRVFFNFKFLTSKNLFWLQNRVFEIDDKFAVTIKTRFWWFAGKQLGKWRSSNELFIRKSVSIWINILNLHYRTKRCKCVRRKASMIRARLGG